MDRKSLEKNPQDEIIRAVNSGSEIVFVTYSILSTTEEYILMSIARILERHGKEEYLTPLYSCVKELISNGTKANAKKILYEEGIIKEDDNTKDIVKKIRTVLNEESLLEFGIKSKLKKYLRVPIFASGIISWK